jgi:hypothetical protein
MSNERMTLEDMAQKYPDEWLFIVDCEHNANTELISGIVAVHSPSRDVINKASAEYKGGAAIRYTGKPPEGRLYLL